LGVRPLHIIRVNFEIEEKREMKRQEVEIQISPTRKIACEEYSMNDISTNSRKFIAIHGWLDNAATYDFFFSSQTSTSSKPTHIYITGLEILYLCFLKR